METSGDFEHDDEARSRAWLASILLQRPEGWLGRFAAQLRRLRSLSKGQRRRLRQKAAVTLTGAAMLLALGAGALARPPAVYAATITVTSNTSNGLAFDGLCSLSEAIINANNNSQIYVMAGECAAGSGADTISLAGNTYTLNSPYGSYAYFSDNGLPTISSEITIEGNGATIERDGTASDFRLMVVDATGSLTLNDTTMSRGLSQEDGGALAVYAGGYALIQDSTFTYNRGDEGGAIQNEGVMVIDNTLIDDNDANDDGGGVSNEDGGELTIRNNTVISNNYAYDDGGGVDQDGASSMLTITDTTISGNTARVDGGGIYNYEGDLTITNSDISGNRTLDGDGGGIYNAYGTLTIADSTISGNEAVDGGGLWLDEATVTVTNSRIDDNTADNIGGVGGGIYSAESALTLLSSTLSNNSADDGGGLYNDFDYSVVTFINSTVSGNSADDDGGGIYHDEGQLFLINTTVTDNTAGDSGGGLFTFFPDTEATLVQSIVSGNIANEGAEIHNRGNGPITADAYNVLGDDSNDNAGAFVNFAPGVSDFDATTDGAPTALADILNTTLQNNGGPTETHALVSGSPALDFGPTAACAADPVFGVDQRGEPRSIDIPGEGNDANASLCDSGAFEYQPPSVCPAEDERVGFAMSSIVGNGMSSDKKLRLASKIFIPNYQDLSALYGQLAGKGPEYAVKYVRFFYPTAPQPAKLFIQDSPAYLPGAIHWYGMELDPARLDTANALKGNMRARWYLTATGKKFRTPRASIYYPTYQTTDEYANVLALFDDSNTNHAAFEPGYNPTATQLVEIPETQGTTDVRVQVAIVDVGDDDRPVLLHIEAGGVVFDTTLLTPTDGPSLNIIDILLEDVPAGTDEVEIMLTSPAPDLLYPDGGDSAAMVGATVNYACGEEGDPR